MSKLRELADQFRPKKQQEYHFGLAGFIAQKDLDYLTVRPRFKMHAGRIAKSRTGRLVKNYGG